MRLVTFDRQGLPAVGVLTAEGEVVDLGFVMDRPPRSVRALLAGGEEALEAVRRAAADAPETARSDLGSVGLLPPVHDPGKVLCLGLNYAAHAAESGHEPPEHPAVFMRSRTSLVGHGRPILRPRLSRQLDFEGELAVVIGRTARHVPEEEALAHVAGYACFDDASVRDVQYWTGQWTLGKNFDATGGFGPCLTTADEVPPGAAGLRITTRVDGRVMQDATTSDMLFSVPVIVSLLSEICTLEPGDVIVTGTPPGVGKARTPPVWLEPGNVVEVEIEGVGLLMNRVADEGGEG
ncbi:MAG TPA: fumarylacetoacetate hydrolase family protein [Gemmatimonadota bacterium]|nr:fumarylacetoacetate hydrolase family protein [Gemmatimonadota bacterium]